MVNVVFPARGSAATRTNVGVIGGAVHRELAEVDDAGAELLGVGDTAASGRVVDHDFSRAADRDRVRRGADFEVAHLRHLRHAVVAHHHQVRDCQPRIDRRVESQRAMHGDRVRHGARRINSHGVPWIDLDDVISRRAVARPATSRDSTSSRSAHFVTFGREVSCEKSGMLWGRADCAETGETAKRMATTVSNDCQVVRHDGRAGDGPPMIGSDCLSGSLGELCVSMPAVKACETPPRSHNSAGQREVFLLRNGKSPRSHDNHFELRAGISELQLRRARHFRIAIAVNSMAMRN